MIKVKQKVSGCFRSQISAQHFARIRGYISTIKKNERSVFVEIQNAFEENPFIPVIAG
jgi:transposase